MGQMGTKTVILFSVGLNSNQPWIEKLYQDKNNLQKRKTSQKQIGSLGFKKHISERYSHSAKLPIKGIPIPSLE